MVQKRSIKRPRTIDPNTVVLIRQIVLGVLIFGFIGGVLLGTWYGTRVAFLTITNVSISGGETIDHSVVRGVVEEKLTGTYLGLVPRRFAWLYPRQSISTAVVAIPRIASAEVKRMSGTELAVTFTEYTPVALWCADVATTTCAFLDDVGYAFATAPTLEGGELLRFVSLATSTPQVGEQPFSTEDMALMVRLESLLTEAGWYVSHLEIDAVRDVYVRIVGGGEFKATLTMAPEQTVANLETVLTSPEFVDIRPGNFQYIDLRFGNKVFINEELAVATSSEEMVASSTADAPSASDGAGDSVPDEE